MRYEPKTIYCPKCCHKVAQWDGRSSNNISVRCRKCKVLVVFNVETKRTGIKNLPPRETASGKMFI